MDKILKYWREVMLVLLFIVCVAGCEMNKITSDFNKSLLQQKDSAFNAIRTYVDDNGKLVTQVNSHELTIKELKDSHILKDSEMNALKKQIGSLSNLVGYWRGAAGFKGKDSIRFKDSIKYVHLNGDSLNALDTVQFKTFGWSNGFLTLKEDYYPFDNVVALEYEYTLGGFELTAYRNKLPREKWYKFRKKQLVADVKFGDPNIEVSQFQAVVIKEEEKKMKWWMWILAGFVGAEVVDRFID